MNTDNAWLLLIVAVIVLTYLWPRTVLTIGGLIGLMVACDAFQAAKADTFTVSVLIESEADYLYAKDAVEDATALWHSQLGVDIAVTYEGIDNPATDTQGQVLLTKVNDYRQAHPEYASANAIVFFTRRTVQIGGIEYAGLATVGPSCSKDAVALVEVRGDGNDGRILAHELMHTVGVPHDSTAGWLMSPGISRALPLTMSPDSIHTFQAANPQACMVDRKPTSTSAGGGGGAFDVYALCILVALLILVRLFPKPENQMEAIATITFTGGLLGIFLALLAIMAAAVKMSIFN